MASPSKMLTAFFPHHDNALPVHMPNIYYDDVAELGLIDLYSMDFQIFDEETWLSGPPAQRSRIPSIMTKSTSLGSLNPSSGFGYGYGLLEMPAGDDETFTPRHSTPVNKSTHHSRQAYGDGIHVNGGTISPIDLRTSPSPPPAGGDRIGDKTLTYKKANRTFEAKDKADGTVSPDENLPEVARPTGLKSLLNGVNGMKSRIDLPHAQPVKQSSIPPPGSRIGLRPPSRPPITTRSTMNRTSSLGNLSSNQKMTLASSGPTARPANGVVPTTLRAPTVMQNGVPPKIGGAASRLVRPTTTAVKLPTNGIPSGIPSRIPIPKLAKKG